MSALELTKGNKQPPPRNSEAEAVYFLPKGSSREAAEICMILNSKVRRTSSNGDLCSNI